MNNTNSSISGYLEIKIQSDPYASEKLKSSVLSRLEELYGNPLPDPVNKRIIEELNTSEQFLYAPLYLTHQKVIRSAENYEYPFFLVSHNGASLINYALDITKVNPLPPHYRCDSCKHTEFVLDNSYDTGFLLPFKQCPKCGERMIGDGQNLRIESFLGFIHDKCPSLALGVPTSKFEDAVLYMEKVFKAKQKDIHDSYYPSEDGFAFVYIDIVPVDSLYADKKVFSFSKMDDPKVFEYLSKPESYECYLPDESDIPLAKELLESICVEHYSDLFKICGLIHSHKWLAFILPYLKSGAFKYRKIITAREDIYRYLMKHGIDSETSYKVMEMTRKGRAEKLFDDEETHRLLLTHGVSEDYIDCLKNIGYIMTHAQTRELATIAYQNAWHHLYD